MTVKFALLAFVAILTPFGARAETTINMTLPIHEEDGSISRHLEQREADDPKCLKCEPVTMGFAISHALNMQFPDEQSLAGEQKWARSDLGAKVKENKAAVLSAPEIALIEKVVGKAYPGNYIRQIIPAIDPNHATPKLAE